MEQSDFRYGSSSKYSTFCIVLCHCHSIVSISCIGMSVLLSSSDEEDSETEESIRELLQYCFAYSSWSPS